MADEIVVRFRVGDIYKQKDLVVYYDDKEISRTKKRVMAPGEMEQIKIKKSSFDGLDVKEIRVCVEEQK